MIAAQTKLGRNFQPEEYVKPRRKSDYRDFVGTDFSRMSEIILERVPLSVFTGGRFHISEAVGRMELYSSSFELPPVAGESAKDRFERLRNEWIEESRFLSSVSQMCVLPSYQKIIGMGWPAVPLMLKQLEQEPDHWFWALEAITVVNPVRPECIGDVVKMAESWVNWGREHRLIP